MAAQFSALMKAARAEVAKTHEETLKEEVATYGKRTEGDWLQRREEYFKALTESTYIEKRNRLVEVLLMFFGDALRQQQGYDRLDLPECAEGLPHWDRDKPTEKRDDLWLREFTASKPQACAADHFRRELRSTGSDHY